ncbi:hypothetical protein LOAG_03657 [Loa loa]|uniref:FBXO47 ARM repeats region domain-containing protein n=2 Tax=Loa loa TaxID=7209 RepID=A0A1S0U465_LOALO|nr:hypothetical protein LOAG_03657 [Loa loa]EFO24828.2 hypothetical protein LOAG_03657 [Loa loa]
MQNIKRKMVTPRLSFVQDYWSPDRNDENWRTYNELSNAYMDRNDRICLSGQITNVCQKRTYISGQACNVDKKQIGRTINEKKDWGSLGIFRVLPRELLHSLFDQISAKHLLSIGLTSKTFNSEVRCYLLLENARRKFLTETTAHMENIIVDTDPFYSWGMLLKASTVVMDSRSRRSFLISFYSKNEDITNWLGWGRFFMAVCLELISRMFGTVLKNGFCEKWDFRECEALMHVVMYYTGLSQLLHRILLEKTGKYPSLEMEIRLRLQGLFMSHSVKDKKDYGFWISAILRTQETTKLQGKLFMIMFGPLKNVENGHKIIDWKILCEEGVNLQHICMRLLGSIALGFHHLTNTSNLGCYAWSDHQLFVLMEEISMVPNKWALHNFAALLALRPHIIHIALFTRLSEGRMDEAAHVFHAVKTVLHRWGVFVSGAVSDVMLKTFRALPEINRRLFLSSILKVESYQLSRLLLDTPFSHLPLLTDIIAVNAENFHNELSSARSISALMTLLAKNV